MITANWSDSAGLFLEQCCGLPMPEVTNAWKLDNIHTLKEYTYLFLAQWAKGWEVAWILKSDRRTWFSSCLWTQLSCYREVQLGTLSHSLTTVLWFLGFRTHQRLILFSSCIWTPVRWLPCGNLFLRIEVCTWTMLDLIFSSQHYFSLAMIFFAMLLKPHHPRRC